MYSSRDLLYDLIVKIMLTRKTAAAAGHVVNMMKPIIAAIEMSSTTNVPSIKKIIGDNAMNTEDIEIRTILRKILGRSTNRYEELFFTYLSYTEWDPLLYENQSLCAIFHRLNGS